MSNEVILNLSFNNQTVTDLTGNWTLDGTPNATYEQIDGRDGYSIVEGSLGRCIVLNAVDQNARYDEYTVDFDMFVKSTYTPNYYNYNVFYLWSRKNPHIVGAFEGKIGEVLSISPTIGGSYRYGATNYSPIGRWVHVTITSGPTGEENLYHTAVYVDGVKLTERTDSGSAYYGNPFGISQRIIPCARDPGSFLMPNGPGVCLNTYKIVAGIHAPNQKPAISLLNLSRVFNNFCTWLKGQLSTVALTGSYNDLSNKPTISTVNDGTLTIQQNGTTVDSFSANSSTNKTANIQCVDLSTPQTIGGVKTFTSNMVIQGSKKVTCNLDNSFIELDGGTTWGKGGSIVLSGQDRSSYTNSVLIVSKSDTNTDLLQYQNGELKPLSNNTNNSSLGTSTNQWASVYAQTYYYNGTEFLNKFVTTDTEQSISQVKEFTRTNSDTLRLKNGRVALGEIISSDAYTQFVFRDKNTDNLAYIRDIYYTDGSTTLAFYARNKYANGAPSTTGSVSYAYLGIGVDATGKPSASVRGDFAPYSDATYNLGTSTNKWSKVYSDDVVHTTGNETIGGTKMFMSLLSKSSNLERGAVPTTNINEDPIFISADKNNRRTLAFFNYYNTNGNGRVILYAYNQNTTNFDNIGLVFNFDNINSSKSIYPVITNNFDFGTSTNKWKSFNGINPGALSLPSTNLINIASSITALDGTTANTFTPQVNGWLLINGTGVANDGFIYVTQGRIGMMSANNAAMLRCAVLIPVVAGVEVNVTCKLTTLTWANIAPCQGNV